MKEEKTPCEGYPCKSKHKFCYQKIEEYNACGEAREHIKNCEKCKEVILNHLFVILLDKWI